jgi:hypothetical protein
VNDSVKELKTKNKLKNKTNKPSPRLVGSNPTDASIFNYLCFLEEFIIQLRHLEISMNSINTFCLFFLKFFLRNPFNFVQLYSLISIQDL